MTNRYAIDKNIHVNDLRFHYRDWNGKGRGVMLLHGLSSTSHIWDLVAPLLVEDIHVVAMDQRGHGISDKPDSAYTFEETGGDLIALLDALNLDLPVIVGHSWGANVALWAAAHHPDRIGGLVLVDGGIMTPSYMTWADTQQRLRPPDIDGMLFSDFRAGIVNHAPQNLITPAVEAIFSAIVEIDSDGVISRRLPVEYHMRILRAMWEMNVDLLLTEVQCPVLILPCRRDGDDADYVKRKEQAVEKAMRLMNDAAVKWLEDTIHDAPLQRPHRIASEVLDFISERL